MLIIMTPSLTTLYGEDEQVHRTPDQDTPTHSHRRLPVEYSSCDDNFSVIVSRSLENPQECRCVSGVNNNLVSENNSYSFHLGGKISPWGPPLLTETRSSNARGEERIRGRSVTRKKRDLPPFLTTLDCNGRPRYHHRRVRSEGRLEIASVAVDSPEIVSVRGREGLRIGTVRISQQNEQEDDD